MSTFLILLGFLSVLVGSIGLVKPGAIKAKSRWHAVPVLCGILACTGLAQLFFPDPATGHPGTIRVSGALLIVGWLFIVGACVRKARQVPSGREKLSPNTVVLGAKSDEGSVADRLEAEFRRYRADQIDLAAYRQAVEIERDDVEEAIRSLKRSRGEVPSEEYEDRLTILEESLDECQWRLEWIVDHREPDRTFPANGKWARFEYADHDGVLSRRELVNWERRGIYIVGYDRSRKQERTFRQDRISEWVAG